MKYKADIRLENGDGYVEVKAQGTMRDTSLDVTGIGSLVKNIMEGVQSKGVGDISITQHHGTPSTPSTGEKPKLTPEVAYEKLGEGWTDEQFAEHYEFGKMQLAGYKATHTRRQQGQGSSARKQQSTPARTGRRGRKPKLTAELAYDLLDQGWDDDKIKQNYEVTTMRLAGFKSHHTRRNS